MLAFVSILTCDIIAVFVTFNRGRRRMLARLPHGCVITSWMNTPCNQNHPMQSNCINLKKGGSVELRPKKENVNHHRLG
jgi:hypothetical protein